MPTRRFWAMENQIQRIQAGDDLRMVNVGIAAASDEARKEITERLSLEIGEPFKMKREKIVKPEASAAARMNALI